ncbi:MAG TPA: SDR family NAD(P)-dependent oxidoreductase [Anaerolineaceae bacterium]|nr:SDR family NAD(P)-dependent oxidoreductase [Anaerolineaceae bacterium]
MKKSLTGKVAIVTGASLGIGENTALALAERGAKVSLAARSVSRLEEIANSIRQQGGEALVHPTDVTDPKQVESLVQATLSCWERIDILVSNAGQYIRRPIREMSMADLERSINVNFYGHVRAVKAVIPPMASQGSGHIILVSSMDGKKGIPPDAPYVSAKFALTGFGDVLRQELRPAGIAVTTILPGRVDTPMVADLDFSWISPKVPARQVSQAILSAIDRRPAEVILPFQAYLLYLLNVFSPRLSDAAVQLFRLWGWKKRDPSQN